MPTDDKVFVFCDGNIPVFEDSYLFCNSSHSHSMGMGKFCSKDDVKAINMYRNSLPCSQGKSHEQLDDKTTLLRKWIQLSTSEQAVFYDLVYRKNVDEKAREFFLQESKENAKTRVKRTYCLECDYNKLSDLEKEPYYEKARQVLKAEKEADAKSKVSDSLKFISDRSVGLIVGLYDYCDDVDKRSFVLYCRKMRPQLLLEPGMFDKYHFQQILILEERWRKLSQAEKEVYYELDARKKLILTEMNNCVLIVRTTYYYDEDREEDNKEEVLQTRIQLVKDFPDFYDLIHEGSDISYLPTEDDDDDDSYSDYQYRSSYRYGCNDACFTVGFLADIADGNAFDMFKKDVCGHENGLKNSIIWDKWFELTEAQQEEYYEKSDNKRWEDRAMVLYESENNFQNFCKCEFERFEKERQFWIEKAKGTYTPDAVVVLEIPEDNNLWLEDLCSTYCPKFLWTYPSIEDKAIYSHVYYKWLKIRVDPEVKEKRIIRICRRLEEEFRNFSPEVKEQKYAEIQRNQEIYDAVEDRVLSPGKIYKKEMEESRSDDPDFDNAEKIWETWRNLSDDEKAIYDEKAKQARLQLMQDFPDFNYYFSWEKSWCKDGDRLCDIIGYDAEFDDDVNSDDDDDNDNNVDDADEDDQTEAGSTNKSDILMKKALQAECGDDGGKHNENDSDGNKIESADDQNDNDQNDAANGGKTEDSVIESPQTMNCNVV